jgi:hypothetical protein
VNPNCVTDPSLVECSIISNQQTQIAIQLTQQVQLTPQYSTDIAVPFGTSLVNTPVLFDDGVSTSVALIGGREPFASLDKLHTAGTDMLDGLSGASVGSCSEIDLGIGAPSGGLVNLNPAALYPGICWVVSILGPLILVVRIGASGLLAWGVWMTLQRKIAKMGDV